MKPWQAWRYRQADLRIVEQITEATARGEVILAVPAWLAAEARQWVYLRKMQHASEHWGAVTGRVSLAAWQDRMRQVPRQERGGHEDLD